MKLGSEDKKKVYAMVGLSAVAVLLLLRALLSSGAPASTVAASATTSALNRPDSNAVGGRSKATLPLDPTLRTDLLKNSEEAAYKGTGRNIFEDTLPPIVAPVVVKKETPQPPPPPPGPPPPPPIPLKFYGFANKPGQAKAIFLANGDDIFIGHEGEIVNRRYKIIRIHPTQVEIEDVLNNNRQSIPLTPG
ncbi:MAG TPA: hypothetical protein VNX88_00275 [Terriglobales bacterium]|jgi:hypothetical protein|nr:hypothetical protein [Terriglobales bacterium]